MIRKPNLDEFIVCDILDLAQDTFTQKLFCEDDELKKMQVFYKFYGNDKCRFALDNIFVYEIDKNIVAACCAYGSSEYSDLAIEEYLLYKGIDFKIIKEFDDGEFYIDSIAILPDFRGKGILKKMLEYANIKAKNNGYKIISLITKTPEFYKNYGFKTIKETNFNDEIYLKMIKNID
ncbi:GNAT family N-acetyltransferase [Campylobacter sp. MG1]|uniref:GNAT family N-acetyltransferase n=1 Tax=Campylobacter sp. MG1 TaxID=2976332 RepID=UPI00226CA4E0|nr:GNAT family N-acetyltransferase [Campylobacter sp. MG1]